MQLRDAIVGRLVEYLTEVGRWEHGRITRVRDVIYVERITGDQPHYEEAIKSYRVSYRRAERWYPMWSAPRDFSPVDVTIDDGEVEAVVAVAAWDCDHGFWRNLETREPIVPAHLSAWRARPDLYTGPRDSGAQEGE